MPARLRKFSRLHFKNSNDTETEPGVSGLHRTARLGFLILDAPIRWLMDLFDTVSGNRGYLAVGSVLAAYLAVFGLIDTKFTQEETRASLERTLFVTLVSSSNAGSFVAGMKEFGSIQLMTATRHPPLFRPCEWFRPPNQPNRVPMLHWARSRLGQCRETKDCRLV